MSTPFLRILRRLFPKTVPDLWGFRPANELGHGAHGAVDAPRARLIEEHGDEGEDQRRDHQTVKTEGKLRRPRGNGRRSRPVPRDIKRPEKGQGFLH